MLPLLAACSSAPPREETRSGSAALFGEECTIAFEGDYCSAACSSCTVGDPGGGDPGGGAGGGDPFGDPGGSCGPRGALCTGSAGVARCCPGLACLLSATQGNCDYPTGAGGFCIRSTECARGLRCVNGSCQ